MSTDLLRSFASRIVTDNDQLLYPEIFHLICALGLSHVEVVAGFKDPSSDLEKSGQARERCGLEAELFGRIDFSITEGLRWVQRESAKKSV
jgi:hypothetical protein